MLSGRAGRTLCSAVLLAASSAACKSAEPTARPETHALADPILELRNYTLLPGQRDTLIELFEREFIESQEALGACIVGTFRVEGAPDHFVWIRSFGDMEARLAALQAFYSGPVWRAHSKAANATMVDSDHVHLLRPVGARLRIPADRSAIGASVTPESLFVVDVFPLAAGTEAEAELQSRAASDAAVIAMFATEASPNDFAALRVHTRSVFVTLRRYDAGSEPARIGGMPVPEETLRLRPTARSLLR